jgi:hypothetical protein
MSKVLLAKGAKNFLSAKSHMRQLKKTIWISARILRTPPTVHKEASVPMIQFEQIEKITMAMIPFSQSEVG